MSARRLTRTQKPIGLRRVNGQFPPIGLRPPIGLCPTSGLPPAGPQSRLGPDPILGTPCRSGTDCSALRASASKEAAPHRQWPRPAALPWALLLACVAGLIGCGPATQSYTLAVENHSDEPMTVWLTKSGPPAEPGWLSPEQIAIYGLDQNQKISGVVIPPHRVADVGPINGKFAGQSDAVLRVYKGQQKYQDMLAISADGVRRDDVALPPGRSRIIIQPDGRTVRESLSDEKN